MNGCVGIANSFARDAVTFLISQHTKITAFFSNSMWSVMLSTLLAKYIVCDEESYLSNSTSDYDVSLSHRYCFFHHC